MAHVTEIAPDVYRISIYAEFAQLQFNHFLIKDDEPLLYHTGLRGMFPEIRDAVAKIIPLADLRHISFSHFESDECGSLNEWLAVAPKADAVCSQVGAIVCVNDCGPNCTELSTAMFLKPCVPYKPRRPRPKM